MVPDSGADYISGATTVNDQWCLLIILILNIDFLKTEGLNNQVVTFRK
jgi:hypothetical protein